MPSATPATPSVRGCQSGTPRSDSAKTGKTMVPSTTNATPTPATATSPARQPTNQSTALRRAPMARRRASSPSSDATQRHIVLDKPAADTSTRTTPANSAQRPSQRAGAMAPARYVASPRGAAVRAPAEAASPVMRARTRARCGAPVVRSSSSARSGGCCSELRYTRGRGWCAAPNVAGVPSSTMPMTV